MATCAAGLFTWAVQMRAGVEICKFNKWGFAQKRTILVEETEAGERVFWQKPGQGSRRDTESSVKVGVLTVFVESSVTWF